MKEINFIIKEIDTLLPNVLKEVVDYISYVKYKYKINNESFKTDRTTLASKKRPAFVLADLNGDDLILC